MKNIFIITLILFATTAIAAQAPPEVQPPPTTKLESFSARTGIVLIRGFSEIGTVNGMGKVSVDAREFRDASNPKNQEMGITIEVKESGRLERESRSFIDYDEIDSLVKGVEYISKIDKTVTTMNNFEATYKTKGDFSITTFSNSRTGEVSAAVSSGRIGKTSAYLSLGDLGKLKLLIIEAKQNLDSMKKVSKK